MKLGDSTLRVRFSILNTITPVVGDVDFHYTDHAFDNLIRDHPLIPDQIHIWEFKIPGERIRLASGPKDIQGEEISDSPGYSFYRKSFHTLRRRIIAGYLNKDSSEIHISYTKSGIPILENLPRLVFTSTSYTEGACIFALSSGYTLGIDIEYLKNDSCLLPIAHRFFYPEEWDFIRALSPEELMRGFYQVWTLKEAYLKAIGRGFSGWNMLPEMASTLRTHPADTTVFPLLNTPYQARILLSDEICQALVFKRIV
jgi:4'-phosphopantetheinyl transferase